MHSLTQFDGIAGGPAIKIELDGIFYQLPVGGRILGKC
jgi:hypothetical protein